MIYYNKMLGDSLKVISKKRQKLQLQFRLQSQQEQTLELTLKNWSTYQCHSLIIDRAYLQSQADMSSFFTQPQELMYTMIEVFDELMIQPEGQIELCVSLSALKINKQKYYQFNLQFVNNGQEKMINSLIQSIREQCKIQIKNTKMQCIRQIQNLKDELKTDSQKVQDDCYNRIMLKDKQIQQKNQEIQLLTSQLRQFRLQGSSSKAAIDQLKSNMKDFEDQITTLKEKLRMQEDKNSQLKKVNQELCKVIQQLRQTITMSHQLQQKRCNFLLQQNPHLTSFYYQIDSKAITVSKKTDNGWTNFISMWSIPLREITKFTIQPICMRDGLLAIGVATQFIIGTNGPQHQQMVSYTCRDGRISERGLLKATNTCLNAQEIMTMQVDRIQQKIVWKRSQQVLGWAQLPALMKQRRLFFTVKVFWKNDAFRLLF